MFTVGSFLDFSGETGSGRDPRIAVFAETASPRLLPFLENANGIELRTDLPPENFKALVRDDSLDAALIVPGEFAENLNATTPAELRLYQRTDDRRTERKLKQLLEDFEAQIIAARLDSLGASANLVEPLRVNSTKVADPRGGIGGLTGTVTGLLLLIALLCATLIPRPPGLARCWTALIGSVAVLAGLLIGYHLLPVSELVRTSLAPLVEPLPLLGILGALVATGGVIALIAGGLDRLNNWGRFLLNLLSWTGLIVLVALFVGGNTSEGIPVLGLLNATRNVLLERAVDWIDVLVRPVALIGVIFFVRRQLSRSR